MKRKMLNAESFDTVKRGTLSSTWNSPTRPHTLGSIKELKERICNKNQRDTIGNRQSESSWDILSG